MANDASEKEGITMGNFYGDISKIKAVYLLKATPYTKEPLVNFSHNLTKEVFFKYLYTERSNRAAFIAENNAFDSRIEYELRDIDNEFAKVGFLHIAGYAGCGKTTYIHHLLRELKDKIGVYDVVDYEGCKRAFEPFIERISHLLFNYSDLLGLCDYFDLVSNKQIFNVVRFHEQLENLASFSDKIKKASLGEISEYDFHVVLENFGQTMKDEATFLSFLIFLDLLMLLYNRFFINTQSPIVLVIDNSDSMSNIPEEMILLSVLKQFANDCTYFYNSNLQIDTSFHGKKTREVFHETKLLVIFTTRIVTIKRYEVIAPDWEKINGWSSVVLPEQYYDHKMIINRRIDYYLSNNSDCQAPIIQELQLLKQLLNIAYHNYNFMRLFNGSVRVCIERLCDIIKEYPQSVINELLEIYRFSTDNPDAIDGANGFFLSLVLNIFKQEHIYEDKLSLSRCCRDGVVSLSRIILTIIRENENRCSLLKLFMSLAPLNYDADDICISVWNLCETGREVWRRLLIFDSIIPDSLEKLQRQATLFKSGNTELENYSDIVICTAGLAYTEFVIPHFEFMLSRHEMGKNTLLDSKYQALFSDGSERKYTKQSNSKGNIGEKEYYFVQKIDWVFQDVKDCCSNSLVFAEKAMKAYSITRDEYIKSTAFNYHSIGWDGEIGPKQSYESRLIFRHIGYIETYRYYLLKKHEDWEPEQLADINRKIVIRIMRYLKLYQDSSKCFQTDSQNRAAEKLFKLAKKIKSAKYMDFDTRIILS